MRSTHFNKVLLFVVTCLLVIDLLKPPAVGQSPETLPDFNTFTFDSLVFQTPGAVDLSGLISTLGYDPSRHWEAGETLAAITELADFGGSFPYSLRSITQASGINPDGYRLSDIAGLIGSQTVADLVMAIPALDAESVMAVPAIATLLQHYGVGYTSVDSVADVLKHPQLAALSLGAIDLSQLSLSALPGLADTSLDSFQGWQTTRFSDVRGLRELSIFSFPSSERTSPSDLFPQQQDSDIRSPLIVQADIVFGPAEQKALRPVTGSYIEGFQVPCQQPEGCPHIELTGQCVLGDCLQLATMTPLRGKQWINGRYHHVLGGSGLLIGLEPTGRHPPPFEFDFKLVLIDTDESRGEATFGLYTHICTPVGCTPHIIGPLPLYRIQEKGLLLM